MSLVKYDPLFSVRQLQDDINRLFSGWSTNDTSGATADWVPSVDINEFDEKFQLFVDVPGVDPKHGRRLGGASVLLRVGFVQTRFVGFA